MKDPLVFEVTADCSPAHKGQAVLLVLTKGPIGLCQVWRFPSQRLACLVPQTDIRSPGLLPSPQWAQAALLSLSSLPSVTCPGGEGPCCSLRLPSVFLVITSSFSPDHSAPHSQPHGPPFLTPHPQNADTVKIISFCSGSKATDLLDLKPCLSPRFGV